MNLIARRPTPAPGWLSEWLRWLGALLAQELAPSPRRIRTSLRMAIIGTLGAGLMAGAHVDTELGPYMVWLLLAPVAMMSPRRVVADLALIAVLLMASVPLAGALSETPWLTLPLIGAAVALSTYELTARKLGAIGLLLQVLTLNVFYGAVSAPADFGWSIAAVFGAAVISFGLILLFDNWLWPQPADALLLESMVAAIMQLRSRFLTIVAFYLDDDGARRPPEPPVTSQVEGWLALLQRAVEEGASARRHAILLAAITRLERLCIQVDRLTIAAREEVPRAIRLMLREELRETCARVSAALAEIGDEMAGVSRPGNDQPPSPAALLVRTAASALDQRTLQVRPAYVRFASAAELANFAAFTAAIHSIVRLIERPLDAPPAAPVAHRSPRNAESRTAGPDLSRYSVKVAVCVVAAYIVALTSQRRELGVILTTVIITALPTYGAAMRKMILRMVGAILGGAAVILVMIIVTPNFESLGSYLIATFIVLMVSAYGSLASGRIADAGKQIGTTFLLAYAALGPSAEIYGPLWRIWGILLGTLVVTAVFFVLWPEYAGDALLPRLRTALRDTISLIPGRPSAESEKSINSTAATIARTLSEILAVAEDSRLEGRKSLIDHEAVVQAAGTLRRISNRLAGIALGRIATPLARLDDETESWRERMLEALGRRLESWLEFFQSPGDLGRAAVSSVAARISRDEIAGPLSEYSRRIEEGGFARLEAWPLEHRRVLLGELESLRRLDFLISELDDYLARVPGTTPDFATSLRPVHA